MLEILGGLSTRVKTGIILIIAMLIIGYVDSYFLFWLVFGIMLIIAVKEAKDLYKLDDKSIYIYILLLWIGVYFYPMPVDLIFIVAIGYASQLAYKRKLDKKMVLPLLYPTASFVFLMTLYSEFGVMVLLWLLVIVAATDTGAYFTGKAFGKTPFSETSPNKTLEGVVGGHFGQHPVEIALYERRGVGCGRQGAHVGGRCRLPHTADSGQIKAEAVEGYIHGHAFSVHRG